MFNKRDPLAIACDCRDYFILGKTGRRYKDCIGLEVLFSQRYGRSKDADGYYCEISALCLDYEVWLANPGWWAPDTLEDFAEAFNKIVPDDDPNY